MIVRAPGFAARCTDERRLERPAATLELLPLDDEETYDENEEK
jgi:hypothetical protein